MLFCSLEQFFTWVRLFRRCEEFLVDDVPLLAVYKSHLQSQRTRKSTALQNRSEYLVHVTRNGAGQRAWNMVDWKNHGHVLTRYPAYSNIIDNVPHRARGETVLRYATEDEVLRATNHRVRRAVRPEQKPLPLLRELICRFSMPSDTVVDLFCGTFSTGRACMSIPNGE